MNTAQKIACFFFLLLVIASPIVGDSMSEEISFSFGGEKVNEQSIFRAIILENDLVTSFLDPVTPSMPFGTRSMPDTLSLGNYPNIGIALGSNSTISPSEVPTNTSRITASTTTNFKGTFSVNPSTGIVRVVNAHPAGVYTVTVKAFGAGAVTKTFTLTVINGSACPGQVAFTNAPNITGISPRSIAIADFNNDGKQDLVFTNFNSLPPIASVRLGDGLGGFSGGSNVTVAFSANSVVVGDFNNDGNQDFATVNNTTTGVVGIRLGDGTGNFTNYSNDNYNNFPAFIELADFDKDGNQDFALTSSTEDISYRNVTVRLGDGVGQFFGNTSLGVGGGQIGIGIGDFNSDGNPDLATAVPSLSAVAVRLGNGSGGFSSVANVPVGANSYSVTVGDFDNNGIPDFLSTKPNSNSVAILLGAGGGAFTSSADVAVGGVPINSALGDFNRDGNQDLAVANAGTANVSIRLGNGVGGFTGSLDVPAGNGSRALAIGDFNADGYQDLAITNANTGGDTVSIRLGACVVSPTPTPTPTPTPVPSPTPCGITRSFQITPPVPIPDFNVNPGVVDIDFVVSGVPTITDLNFRFDGFFPSAPAVDHTWVGDLAFRLTSPSGTSVTIFDRPGRTEPPVGLGQGCGRAYIYSLTLDDDRGFPPVESFCPPNPTPYAGYYAPNNPLAAFDGQNPNGTWRLTATDNDPRDTGRVFDFSLIFGGDACPVPSPTPTPTQTPTPTPTPTPTVPPTPSPTPTPSCTYALSRPSDSFSQAGGNSAPVSVIPSRPECSWVAQSRPQPQPFLRLTPGQVTTGQGAFSYSVDAYPSGNGRTGIIDILEPGTTSVSVVFLVHQPVAGCALSIVPADVYALAQGGPNQQGIGFPIDVTATITPPATQCNWTATANNPWLGTRFGLNNGVNTLFITVDDNPDFAPRTGTVTVGGELVYVFQDGQGYCAARAAARARGFELNLLYNFRDEVLENSPRGRKYADDYYTYAGEITKIMIFNPDLFSRVADTFLRYMPVVGSITDQKRAERDPEHRLENAPGFTRVADAELEDVDELLEIFAAKGSDKLREKLTELRSDMHDPEFQAEFGVRIEPGSIRPLPDRERWSALSSTFSLPSKIAAFNPFASIPSSNQADAEVATVHKEPKAGDKYGQIPMSFEKNVGQVDPSVKYISRGSGHNLFLTKSEAVLSLPVKETRRERNTPLSLPNGRNEPGKFHALRMKLDGVASDVRVHGRDRFVGQSNYFIGSDPAKWRRGVPNYGRVKYASIYPGIDLEYYGDQRQLEYDYVVRPGGDPSRIGLTLTGADSTEIRENGDLAMQTPAGEVRLNKPYTYQDIGGERREVASRYALDGNRITFEIGDYDRNHTLVIDPVIVYSTYLGGSGDDHPDGITVDSAGNAYIVGFTDSANFPRLGAAQNAYGGDPQDVFVSKINAAGTALVYSTYLGGNGQDNGSAIAVDASGNAYITGYSGSANFPTTKALQRDRTGPYNAFVTKLNPTGSQIVYSTYFGGTVGEFGSAIAVDAAGNAYFAGVTSSPDMPKTNPIQPFYGGDLADAFVAKLNPAGGQLVYSTYLGGNGNDGITGLAVDASGNVHVTGVTFSSNFPVANAIQPQFRGGAFDAFAVKINPAGSALVYSTYLGGSGDDRGYRVRLDGAGNAYVAGSTESANFPAAGAIQPTLSGVVDAFVTKLTPAGSISYSTYFGGSGLDGATGLVVNSAGNVFLTGYTSSSDFPLVRPLQDLNGGGLFDSFAVKIKPGGTALDYSTYLGGSGDDSGFDIGLDPSGNAFVFGRTASTNFPTAGPLQPSNAGGTFDLSITKIWDAPAQVSGRVLTPSGLALRNVTVSLTDPQGGRRTATTSPFGGFLFTDVPTGPSYTLTVSSKRYRFAPRIFAINGDLTNIDLIGLE